MSTEGANLEKQHNDTERYHTGEGPAPEGVPDFKASTQSEELGASGQEIDRDSEKDQIQGSGAQPGSEETVTRNAEPTPDAPVKDARKHVDEDDEDDDDSEDDDSDDEDFPRNEDVPRGRVVGPVAGQRPPKPR